MRRELSDEDHAFVPVLVSLEKSSVELEASIPTWKHTILPVNVPEGPELWFHWKKQFDAHSAEDFIW